MQQDFKNQLQNTMAHWLKKGQSSVEQWVGEARAELQTQLAEKGLAHRWPALISLIQETMPDAAPLTATLLARQAVPMADWLQVEAKNWEPYKLELKVSPKPHLLTDGHWQTNAIVALTELAGRWLVEKHVPPGNLIIKTQRLELAVVDKLVDDCTVRCELDPIEFEGIVAGLLKDRESQLELPVLVFNANNVLLSQVNFTFELQWRPLLK